MCGVLSLVWLEERKGVEWVGGLTDAVSIGGRRAERITTF